MPLGSTKITCCSQNSEPAATGQETGGRLADEAAQFQAKGIDIAANEARAAAQRNALDRQAAPG